MGTLWIGWTVFSLATLTQQVELPRPTLRVVWVDVSDVVPSSFEAMARESVSILQDVGVDLSWERADVGVLPDHADVTVILLNSRPSAGLNRRCMGAARPGTAPHAVWVYLPNVLWALGTDLKRDARSAAEVRELGVALGRVAAHEIAHALAPGLRHSTQGLMAERLTRADLQRVKLSLDEPSRRVILSGLSQRLAEVRR